MPTPTDLRSRQRFDAEHAADQHGLQRQGRQRETGAGGRRVAERDVVENEEQTEKAQSQGGDAGPVAARRPFHAQHERYRQHEEKSDAPAQNGERERIGIADQIARDGRGRAAETARNDRDQHPDQFAHAHSPSGGAGTMPRPDALGGKRGAAELSLARYSCRETSSARCSDADAGCAWHFEAYRCRQLGCRCTDADREIPVDVIADVQEAGRRRKAHRLGQRARPRSSLSLVTVWRFDEQDCRHTARDDTSNRLCDPVLEPTASMTAAIFPVGLIARPTRAVTMHRDVRR